MGGISKSLQQSFCTQVSELTPAYDIIFDERVSDAHFHHIGDALVEVKTLGEHAHIRGTPEIRGHHVNQLTPYLGKRLRC